MDNLEGIEENVIKPLVKAIAVDLATSNDRRIHNEGLDVDGRKIGDYAESTKKVRKRSGGGKEIDYVNLTFTGKLSKEFQVVAIDDLNYGVGFISPYGTKLSIILEKKYDREGKIWGVTEDDDRIAQEEFQLRLDKYLKTING